MGRPNKPEGAPFFYSSGIKLLKEDEDQLLEYLGYDEDFPHDTGLILSDISTYLGAYEGTSQVTDNAPRPANYIAEIGDASAEVGEKKGLVYDANDLLQKLCNSSYWTQEVYEAAGYDLNQLERELGKFIDASSKVTEAMKNKESRGASTNEALKITVNHLNVIFEKYYSIPEIDEELLSEEDQADGRALTGKEIYRSKFIELCLIKANIPHNSKWKKLLYKEGDSPEEKKFLKRS